MNKKYIITFVVFLILILNIGQNMARAETYGVYIGYPRGYYSEFNNQHSVLLNEKNQIITRFGGRNATVGQLGHGVQNSSNSIKEIPSKIKVMWFSIPENQFWLGEFELPKKELSTLLNKEKVLDVFSSRKGNMKDKYDEIIVNVAPKGKVYIYVGGMATKLVGIYQAEKIDYEWEQHARDTWLLSSRSVIEPRVEYVQDFINGEKKDIDTLPQFYNEEYFRPVYWTLSLKGEDDLIAYITETINGENVHVLKNINQEVIESIPKEIAFDFVHNQKVRRLNIIFNQPYEFFKEHFDYRSKVQIILDMPNQKELNVYFQQGEKIVEFKDIEVEEYDR